MKRKQLNTGDLMRLFFGKVNGRVWWRFRRTMRTIRKGGSREQKLLLWNRWGGSLVSEDRISAKSQNG